MKTDILISQADPNSLVGAKLNLMAVGDMAHSIVGSSNQSITDATFRMLWKSKNNRFSHEFTYEAKIGDKSLGMITCLPYTTLDQLGSSTAKQLFSYRKLGLKEGFEGEYHIATLAAMPESRGMGIGSQLIQHAEEQAIRQGYNLSSLTVKKENPLAAKLYVKLG